MADPFDPNALGPDARVAVTRNGERGTIPKAKLAEYIAHGWQSEDPEATKHERLRQEYGDQTGQAALEGAASALTFGGSDLALRELDPEGSQARAEFSPWARAGGELGGAILGGGVGLGGALGEAGEAVEGAVTAGKSATLGTKVLGGAAKGAVEGLGYGAGSGVSQVALSPDPITWEGAASTIGSSALGGAALGVGIGVTGKMLIEGAGAAQEAAAKHVETLTTGGEAVDRGAFPDVAGMDQETAAKAATDRQAVLENQRAADITEGKTAYDAEKTRLEAERGQKASGLYQEAKQYKDAIDFVTTGDNEVATMLGKTELRIMKGLNNEGDFADEILNNKLGKGSFQSALRTQAEALTRVLDDAPEVMRNAEADAQKFADELPKPKEVPFNQVPGEGAEPQYYLSPEQSKIYADHFGVEMPKGQPALTIGPDELSAYRAAAESGQITLPKVQRIQTAQQFLERNTALQAKIAEVAKPVASDALKAAEERVTLAKAGAKPDPYLQSIKAHQADLQKSSIGRTLAQGVGGMVGGKLGFMAGGPVGAVAGGLVGRDAANKLYDRFVRKIVAANEARGQTIKKAIAGIFEKGASKVASAVPSATKIIPAIQYASKKQADAVLGPARVTPSRDKTVEAFRDRARELNSVTERTATGFQVRQLALEALHDRMAGVWSVNAAVANGIEKAHAVRLQYLASKLPRDPTPPHLQMGPSTWEPSHAQMAQFARIMQVAEHPEVVPQRLANGTATPDDVDTLKTLYPGHYEDIRQQCMTHAATLERTLPYVQRLNLSILLDVDVDPALTPEAMSVYQRPQPPPDQKSPQQAPTKPLPTGMIEPTMAQRFASK